MISVIEKQKGNVNIRSLNDKKVRVGNDQKKAQSERHSHTKNRGGKN